MIMMVGIVREGRKELKPLPPLDSADRTRTQTFVYKRPTQS